MGNKIRIREKVYVPEKIVDMQKVENIFYRSIYNESKCERCEYLPERHCDVCDDCDNFVGNFKLYSEKRIKGKDYVGIPFGAKGKVKKLLTSKKYTVVNECTDTPFRNRIKFIGTEYDYQKDARRVMMKAGYGVLKAPPRSGKTCMAVSIMCKHQKKTIILATQREWLVGFYETIVGNKNKGMEPFTNAAKIEKKTGKKIVGFPKTLKEYEQYDICLVTVQSLNSTKGKKLLEQVKDMFGVLICDEVHDAGARVLSSVINQFSAKHKYGLSGTPDRKDGKYYIAEAVMGKIKHDCKIKTLTPKVTFVETGVKNDKHFSIPVYAHHYLERSKKRHKMIVKMILNDVENGHHVVVPVMHKKYMQTLVQDLNTRAGKEIAVAFHGGLTKDKKDSVIADAQAGKIKVVVGIRRMVQVGINIPLWSALYEIFPISNPPKFTQETARILTNVPGKKEPVIRFFLDDLPFSRGCLRTCMYVDGMIKKRFIISERDMATVRKYVAQGNLKHERQPIKNF